MTDTTAVELPPGVVLAALPDTAGAHMVYRFDGQEPDQVELSATARLSGTRVLVGEDDRPSLDILERAELVSRRTRPAAPATLTDTAPQGTLGVSPTTAEAEPLAKAVMAEVGKRASVPQGGVQIRIGRAHGDLAEHPDLGTDYRVPVAAHGTAVSIGPVISADRGTACPTCLGQRERALLVEALGIDAGADPGSVAFGVPDLVEPLEMILPTLVAAYISHRLPPNDHPTRFDLSHMVRFNLATWQSQTLPAFPAIGCPDCDRGAAVSPLAATTA